ncbi:MAG TPA: S8 family serine peptidase [Streptosporangiaceae bacterium]|nr:S8 family serine peptidase [Streptosporangiaceae bacterium]
MRTSRSRLMIVISQLRFRGQLAAVAAILVVTPLAVSATAAPASARTAISVSAPGDPNPDHIQLLTAALQNMHDNYANFARFNPGPRDIFDYNIGKLWLNGIDGSGTTVAVIEGWNDPGIDAFIHVRDVRYGLPDPDIQTIYPSGPLPAQCPAGMVALGSYGSCDAWVGELRLDVLAVHLMAPYAKIVISATPADSEINDDPASNVAPPEMMRALEMIASQHIANVISISDGTGESTYPYGVAQIHANDPGPLAAAAAGIPVLNATGDCGVVQNLAVANSQCGNTTTFPDTATWDDNPFVTAVGGSVPNISPTDGSKLGPDPLWHSRGIFSEGAGFSSVYARPTYQDGVASITGSPWRSVPDITMDAQSGTSEAAPLLGGVLALATQLNHGKNVGPINPVLYGILGPLGSRAGISDVVSGNNSVIDPNTGQVLVPGFTAGPGFDVASGWGTIDASVFVPALVFATRNPGVVELARDQAQRQLHLLEQNASVSPGRIAPGGTATVTGTGFLPVHPVTLTIDGSTIITLTAGQDGTVSYKLDPAALGLRPGQHTLTIGGMLITTTTDFRNG